jgi:hypothetical protein
MKLVWILFIVFVVSVAKPREGFKKSYRYFKITCSTSNKTCVNPFCRIKNSRNESTYSAGCDLIKPDVVHINVRIIWDIEHFLKIHYVSVQDYCKLPVSDAIPASLPDSNS